MATDEAERRLKHIPAGASRRGGREVTRGMQADQTTLLVHGALPAGFDL